MFNKKAKLSFPPYSTVIGKDANFHGELRFSGGVHVDGKFIGDIIADTDSASNQSAISISATGFIQGNIVAPQVVIDGTVAGDVRSSQRVVLASSARIHGTLYYGTLSMDDGAEIHGRMVRLGTDGQPVHSLNKLVTSPEAEIPSLSPSRRMLDKLGNTAVSNPPLSCTGWEETRSAFHLLSDPKATVDGILAKHINCTEARGVGYARVLCHQSRFEINDFSEENVNPQEQGDHSAKRGMPLYPLLAVTPEQIPLGLLAIPGLEANAQAIKALPLSPQASIDDAAWALGLMRVNELANSISAPTLTYLADLETGFRELLAVATHPDCHVDWLIRIPYRDGPLANGESLFDVLDNASILGEIGFEQPVSRTRRSRMVRQHVRVARVVLDANSWTPGRTKDPSVVALLANEINPPTDEEPQDWLLLTNIPTKTSNEAVERLRWYLSSRQSDAYLKVLRTGLRIEERHADQRNRAKLHLAYQMVLAWRVTYLIMLAKESQETPIEQVFTSEEWKAIYLISQRQPAPEQPPALIDLVRMVASLGGFVSRGGDDHPGPSTVWVGLQRASHLVEAFSEQGAD